MNSRHLHFARWNSVLGMYVVPVLALLMTSLGGAIRSMGTWAGESVSVEQLEFAGLVMLFPMVPLTGTWCLFSAVARYYRIHAEAIFVVFAGFLYMAWRVGMWTGKAIDF